MGNDRRSRSLHRLRGLRRGLPCGKQYADCRAGAGRDGADASMDPHRALLGRRVSEYPGAVHAGDVPALRRCALRAGLSGVRDVPYARRTQRAGLQPLRRHALLREQLPVHRAVFQLVHAAVAEPAERAAESRRHGPQSGIMEKCTFCVQRIRRAQDTAKDEKRAVRDGEIQPACAQAARRRCWCSAT